MIGLLDMQQRMRENIYIKLGFVVHTKQQVLNYIETTYIYR